MAATDFKDYYAVLEVSRSAQADEIKRAFRRLARKYHPDMNPGDQTAETRFKEINEAYEVLSDPEKRRKYDQFGQYWKQAAQAGASQSWSGRTSWPGTGTGSTNTSFEDVEFSRFDNFDEFINDLLNRYGAEPSGYSSYRSTAQPPGGFGGFNDVGSTSSRVRVQDLDREVNLMLTFSEAFHGVKKRLSIGNETMEVQIPPGVKPGNKVRLKGKGQQYNQQRGDLYLLVDLQAHTFFQLDGDNLLCEVPIAPDEAVLGAQIDVPTPDGSVRVNVPAGIRSGQSLRLKGKGWPTKTGRGDQMIRILLTAPKQLSATEQELYEKIRAVRSYNPRSSLDTIKL